MGVACLCVGVLRAGDAAPDALVSLQRNATVSIGGEVATDFVVRHTKGGGGAHINAGDFEIKNTNLRLRAEVHPNLKALFKLDLSDDSELNDSDRQLLEEAMLVMDSVGGTGLSLSAGKGRAPYGQDVTLGLIQSYHHSANRNDTSEGRVFVVDPPATRIGGAVPSPGDRWLPPPRPGQIDRVVMAGAAYEWDSRWRFEAAVFQPDFGLDRYRVQGDAGNGKGVSARLWWQPVEGLVAEVSGVVAHSSAMGDPTRRLDLDGFASARKNEWALSAGVDWRFGDWNLFGEYQHGFDWNFTRDYDVDIAQLGAARYFGSWRVGGMVEWLGIDDPSAGGMDDDYFKLTLNVRYMFANGAFVTAEYGKEWFRRVYVSGNRDKRHGDIFGVRFGFSF